MTRGQALAILLAAVVGLSGGLYYAWAVNPVSYTDTAPVSLRADFKADYLALIASAYANSGDLGRAKARLALFADPDPAGTLAALAQQRLAQGWPETEARALARLAVALGALVTPELASTTPTALPSLTPSLIPSLIPSPIPSLVSSPGASPSPAASSTSTAAPSPAATVAPSATPGLAFRLAGRDKVCDPRLPAPLIEVEVFDAAGMPVPGIEARVVWDTGEDHFFTGLKPELGLGYGDFTMTPGTSYTLQLAASDQPITGLTAEPCAGADGKPYPGSWKLRFEQPAR